MCLSAFSHLSWPSPFVPCILVSLRLSLCILFYSGATCPVCVTFSVVPPVSPLRLLPAVVPQVFPVCPDSLLYLVSVSPRPVLPSPSYCVSSLSANSLFEPVYWYLPVPVSKHSPACCLKFGSAAVPATHSVSCQLPANTALCFKCGFTLDQYFTIYYFSFCSVFSQFSFKPKLL